MFKFFRKTAAPLCIAGVIALHTATVFAQAQQVFLPFVAGNAQIEQTISTVRQLRYQVGHTYTYQWDLTVRAQSVSRDAQGVQAGDNTSQLTGLVDLQVLGQEVDGTYELSLAVHNPSIVVSAHDAQATTLDDPALLAALGQPLLFKQANTGEIREVRYPLDAPTAAVEIQKGLVNTLQFNLRPDAQYTVEEQGGQGRYQSHYTVTEGESSLQIAKRISTDDFSEMVSAGDAEAKIALDNQVDLVLDAQQGVLQSVHVAEQIGMGDPSAGLGATDGVTDGVTATVSVETQVVSDGWLRLIQVQATDSSAVVAAMANYVQGSLRPTLTDTITTETEIDLSTVQIDSELQALAQAPTNPALIQRVADLIRQDQSQQMLQAVGAQLGSTNDEQVVGSYISVLSLAATPAAQDVLIDRVLAVPGITDTLKIRALTELADVGQPSLRLVEAVRTLSQTDNGELSAVAVLTLGALADALQASDPQAADLIAADLSTRLQQAQTLSR